jgi:ParB family transcriptional regulator, chromosome partitioning protein
MKNNNKGLGRGLDALIKPDFYEESSMDTSISSISINKIEASDNQPRTMFDEEKIQELSSSIKKQGVLQPILVRKNIQGKYQIIAGERRWRASIIAGLKTIPAIIRDYTDSEALAIALIENLQREDLNIMEQAKALERLKNELGINQEELADYIGKSRSHLANTLRLINLPDQIKNNISNNLITAGHARALLALKNHEGMLAVSDEIIRKKLSVRETESLIKKLGAPKKPAKTKGQTETSLGMKMKTLVKERINQDLEIKFKGTAHKGQLVINYTNEKQLNDFLKILEESSGN